MIIDAAESICDICHDTSRIEVDQPCPWCEPDAWLEWDERHHETAAGSPSPGPGS